MADRFQTLFTTGDLTPEMEELGIQNISAYKGSPQLISQVPGEQFTDISYDPYGQTAYSDLYNLYYGGGFDAAQPDFVTPPADTTPIDTGGRGDGTGIITDSAAQNIGEVNTPFEQNLIDQGAGVQIAPGQPVVAPGEMPVTQEEIDKFNQIPITPVNEFPTGDASLAEQTEAKDRAAKALADEQALTNLEKARTGQYDAPTETYADTGDPDLLDLAGGELGGSDAGFADKGVPVGEAYAPTDTVNYSELDDLEADPGAQPTELGGKINSAFENVKGRGIEATEDFKNTLIGLGGKVKEGFENIIDFGNTQIDVTKTLATGVINYVGKNILGPVGALIGTALQALPEGGPTLQTSKAQSIGLAGENEYQDKYGINTQSQFGDYDQYNIDRVEELQEKIDDGTIQQYKDDGTLTYLGKELKDRQEYNKISGVGGDIDDDPTGDAEIAEIIARDDRIDAGIEAAEDDKEDVDIGPVGVDAGTADVQDYADIYEPSTPAPAPSPAPSYSPPSPHRNGGGNGARAGGGSQKAQSGGSSPSGGISSHGGWGWAKGGIVSLKNGKR